MERKITLIYPIYLEENFPLQSRGKLYNNFYHQLFPWCMQTQFLLYTKQTSSLDVYNNYFNLSTLPRILHHYIASGSAHWLPM